MKQTTNRSSLSGTCAIIVGVLSLVALVLVILLPQERQGDNFLPSFYEQPLIPMLRYIVNAIIAVLGLAVVGSVTGIVESAHKDWSRWAGSLGYLGFATIAVNYMRLIAIVPDRAEAYVTGDASTQASLISYTVNLDPNGWLSMGAVGLWILIISILAMRGARLSKVMNWIGIAYALFAVLTVVGSTASFVPLAMIGGLAGVVAGTVWFIWVGTSLLRGIPAQEA